MVRTKSIALAALTSLLFICSTAVARCPGQVIPIFIAPVDSVLDPQESTQVTIGIAQAVGQDAVISLNSNNSHLSIPSTVTIIAGQTSATFSASNSWPSEGTHRGDPSTGRITGSANGYSVYTDLTLNP